MWEFHGLPYQRPDTGSLRAAYEAGVERLRGAQTYAEARGAFLALDKMFADLGSAETIASIRNTMDTRDAFYKAEMDFFNEEMAKLTPVIKKAMEALLASPFRKDFEAEFGPELFVKEALNIRTKSEAIVPDLIEESELCVLYRDKAAGCQVSFMGETVNFYGLLKHMESPDRAVRRAAFAEWASLYEGISADLDGIFDRLAAVRVRMAEKLGFANYTELAYANMGRASYGAAEVAAFRAQVRDVIVPAVARYRARQAERIGVDKLRWYDENYMYPDGNADPKGGEAELKAAAARMYKELSPETDAFYRFMLEHNLFDLTTRPGKHLGGYCTALPDLKAPFIFSNFNGTAADVGVLTHEAGHAFAAYTAMRTQPISAYLHAGAEVAEIHSMTMEHFTYPWLNLLYGEENVQKAKYAHLCDALCAIPYLVAVDDFQHRVYANPGQTAADRRKLWKEVEQTYMPWRDYDGNAFLAGGGFWMQKQHIFLYPFYYIDYALAQTCAFEFYGRMKEDRDAAWADYLRLCGAGGSLGYFDLLKLANLSSPFAEGTVRRAVAHVIEELDVHV